MRLEPLVEPGPPLDREQVRRYSRHLLLGALGEEGQRRLRAARVAVVGAGGLGAPVLQYLAAAGVGRLTVIDDDDVDPSNLQRQVVHTTADVGRPKVDSAAEHVRALNPEVEVRRERRRLTEAEAREVLAGHHLVIDGTDNFPTRYLVSDACADLGVPVVWGSILRFDAQVSVFWSAPRAATRPRQDLGTEAAEALPRSRDPHSDGEDGGRERAGGREQDGEPERAGGREQDGVTLRDLFPAPPPEGTTPSCGEAGVLGAMCGQVGSVMATEAVKLITGAGETLFGRVLVLDALTQRWTELPVRPRRRPSPPPSPGAAITRSSPAPPPGTSVAAPVPGISVTELAGRLAARERDADDLVLLDVREAAERSIAVIPGSVHIPLAEVLADPARAAARLGSSSLLVHCRSGQRSARAVEAFREAGIPAVNVEGGLLAWAEEIDPDLPTY